jgi:magnesium chelatase subunit I
MSDQILEKITELCLSLKTDGLRGELSLSKAARAYAALNGKKEVKLEHVKQIACMSLRHRLRRDPLDDSNANIRVQKVIEEVLK